MAYAVPSRVLAQLHEHAVPLTDCALEVAPAMTAVHDGATEVEIKRSQRVVAVNLAVQALLHTPQLGDMTEFDVTMALAAVCGAFLSQVSQPRELYEAFRAQTAATIKEIATAKAQRGTVQ